ncbi:MAG: radical SAM protein [Pseudomonadota bacterium]
MLETTVSSKLNFKNPTIGSNANSFKIFTWVLGNVCNYSCSYCPDELHNGEYRFPDIQVATDIFNKFRGSDPIYYELLGGEPTYWPHLQEYLNHISDENTFVEVNTNGSRSAKYWKKFSAPVDLFYISFHPESADEKSFTENLEIISENYRVYVAFLAHPKYWSKIEKYYRYLSFERQDLNINTFLSMIRPDFGSQVIDGLTDEMKNLWKEPKKNRAHPVKKEIPRMLQVEGKNADWRRFSLARLNEFKNFECHIPNKRLFIHVNGDMYYASCKEGGKIGNAYTGEYDLSRTDPIICSQKFCGCKLDALVPKNGPLKKDIPSDIFFP